MTKSYLPIILGAVIFIVIIAIIYYLYKKKTDESFSSGLDPSTRLGTANIGPVEEGYCSNCM